MIINGKLIADEIVSKLKEKITPKKFLGVIFVGDDMTSARFIAQKKKIAELLGVDFRVFNFKSSINQGVLLKETHSIVSDEMCGGLIVQLPIPLHLDRDAIFNSISTKKDLDSLSCLNKKETLAPSVLTFCEVLSHYQLLKNVSCETNLKFGVVGPGFLIGKPIMDYLHQRKSDCVVFDRCDDLSQIKNADVVVLGVGIPNLVNQKMIKDGALVIDFGCSFIEGELCGDLLRPTSENFWYTPTPGGTGPILVAKLFENFYKLNTI